MPALLNVRYIGIGGREGEGDIARHGGRGEWNACAVLRALKIDARNFPFFFFSFPLFFFLPFFRLDGLKDACIPPMIVYPILSHVTKSRVEKNRGKYVPRDFISN